MRKSKHSPMRKSMHMPMRTSAEGSCRARQNSPAAGTTAFFRLVCSGG
ncbi:MAG: hypothetical protein RBR41_11640 [Desulfovibrio sp.]|nr:hypothetical protein [Desulfovibrio sp.]MDY0260301.1 hypothetical protein [Desulfovibrio sp.]